MSNCQLIWVQTVCNCYQQITKVTASKERVRSTCLCIMCIVLYQDIMCDLICQGQIAVLISIHIIISQAIISLCQGLVCQFVTKCPIALDGCDSIKLVLNTVHKILFKEIYLSKALTCMKFLFYLNT